MKWPSASALSRPLLAALIMGAVVFLSAWTLDYPEAWVFLAVVTLACLAVVFRLADTSPDLWDRQLEFGEDIGPTPLQEAVQIAGSVSLVALLVVPGLDRRFEWSHVPPIACAAGDVLSALGLYLKYLVWKEDIATVATTPAGAQQYTIRTGPYALVRHPMVTATLVTFAGVPIALGSWYATVVLAPMLWSLLVHVHAMDNSLPRCLPDYDEYREQVKWRLIPYVW